MNIYSIEGTTVQIFTSKTLGDDYILMSSENTSTDPWVVSLSDGTWDASDETEYAYRLNLLTSQFNEDVEALEVKYGKAMLVDGDNEDDTETALQDSYATLKSTYTTNLANIMTSDDVTDDLM